MKDKIKFEIGSKYFFRNLPGYVSKDTDILVIMDSWMIGRTNVLNMKRDGEDIFFYKDMNKEEFINDTLNSKVPMRVGKFLNKEFNEYLGFTIDDLKVFNELFNELDKEHLYEKRIYEYYIENNKFELTEEQLLDCYKVYKENKK